MRRVGDAQRRVDQRRAQRIRQRWTRRDFDQLLMAALQRAFALPQMRDRASVADDLHFDVARVGQQFLGIESGVAECGLRLGGAARERLVDVGRAR